MSPRPHPTSFVTAASIAVLASLAAGSAPARAQTADDEPPITVPGPEGDYLRAAHKRVHTRWTDNFLVLAARELPASNPINEKSRIVVVDVVIMRDGRVLAARVNQTSGHEPFDTSALDVVRDSGPFPPPGAEMLSDDGNLHLRWALARDARRCSGVQVVRQEDNLEVALPALLKADRGAEAIRRVTAARTMGVEPAISALARTWLAESLRGPFPSVRAAVTLSALGNTGAKKALRQLLSRPETAGQAAEALLADKTPICPLVKKGLEEGDFDTKHAAALALRNAGEEECAGALVKLLDNLNANPEIRASAAEALASIKTDAAKEAVTRATKDPAPTVRGAAILASTKPDSGRGTVIRLSQLIKDPAPEVRAGAAAAIVRAGGDIGLSEMFFLFKENDPRPSEVAGKELARLTSDESARLLVRLLKRPQPRIRLAAAQALAARSDGVSKSALKAVLADPKAPPELRAQAVAAADPADLPNLARDKTLGPAVYRAQLKAGQREPAADWLLANLMTVPPSARIDLLSDWLTTAKP